MVWRDCGDPRCKSPTTAKYLYVLYPGPAGLPWEYLRCNPASRAADSLRCALKRHPTSLRLRHPWVSNQMVARLSGVSIYLSPLGLVGQPKSNRL
jgi:hypothetical protein